MSLLTVLLPFIGGALVYIYNAYKTKTGVDPLANKPVLQALFAILSKEMSPSAQMGLAQQLGIHNDPATLQTIIANQTNAAFGNATSAGANGPFPYAPTPPPSPAGFSGGAGFLDQFTHLPIRLSISPEFVPHLDSAPTPTPSPGIKLANTPA